MGFRLQNFAPLGPEEFLWGWVHKLRGFKRQLFNHPINRFIDSFVSQGLPVEAVQAADKSQARCHICGYAIAALVAGDGWRIEACSATTLKNMLGNERFTAWRKRLPPARSWSKDAAEPAQRTHLQTSGH